MNFVSQCSNCLSLKKADGKYQSSIGEFPKLPKESCYSCKAKTETVVKAKVDDEVERTYLELERVSTERSRGTGTSCEDVLMFMYEHPEKIWYMSWEFINQVTKDGKFLSHRAPARASDLAIHSPLLVEDRKIGRFSCYRIRRENESLIRKHLGL